MQILFAALPLLGSVIGFLGLYLDQSIAFWIGAILALANLSLDLVSGSMRLPILPAALMIVAAGILDPWYVGAAAGLFAWTALSGIGALVSAFR